MNKTNYFENLLLKAIYQNNAAAQLELNSMDIQFALYTATLTDTSETATTNELSAGGYSRITHAAIATAHGTAPSAGSIANTGAISFPAITSGSGEVKAFGLVDNATGKIWYWNNTGNIPYIVGTIFQISAGALTHTED